ncbi:DUF3850 domain-containing protein [Sphingopyxis terrae subsp. ummariensis]
MAHIDESLEREADAKPRAPIIHELKCWPEFFAAIAAGDKRHDLRRCYDRDFAVGDRLQLREFDPISQCYTGREQYVAVTYITSASRRCALSDEALHSDFCILSIALSGEPN